MASFLFLSFPFLSFLPRSIYSVYVYFRYSTYGLTLPLWLCTFMMYDCYETQRMDERLG